jgi:DNA-binding Lrp family transcriptional regulator
VDEAGVIALLTRLKNEGVIRRFGASIKHQKTGWTHNVMVAWRVDEALADAAGAVAEKHPNISHCYYRQTSAPDWPYAFFTMIHGRSAEECQAVIESLRRESVLDEYAALESLKELKKTSMTYF